MHLTSYLNVVRLKNCVAGTGPQVALELVVQAETERAYAANWDNRHSKSAKRTPLDSISIKRQLLISTLRNAVQKKAPTHTAHAKKYRMHNTQESGS